MNLEDIDYCISTCGDGFSAEITDMKIKVYGDTVNEAIDKLSDAVRQIGCESA